MGIPVSYRFISGKMTEKRTEEKTFLSQKRTLSGH